MNSNSLRNYVREPAFSGTMGFYPSDPDKLTADIRGFIDGANRMSEEIPWGLIAPHAGYVYSGSVAGWTFRQVDNEKIDQVIVIAPSHRESFDFASILPRGAYRTPLGDIEVDRDLAESIAVVGGDAVRLSDDGHRTGGSFTPEHSLEVQLPFLQVALGDFTLVPIITARGGWDVCQALGKALAEVLEGRNALVVASSDLSHFHQYDVASRIDQALIGELQRGDARALVDGCDNGSFEACGGLPIATLMFAAGMAGASRLKVLKYANSGDVTEGEKDRVVGYLAAAYYRNSTASKNESRAKLSTAISSETPTNEEVSDLTAADKKHLLHLARVSIAGKLGAFVNPPASSPPTSTGLNEIRGLFVTIRLGDDLRGCIGQLNPAEPLVEAVEIVARQAAFDDPRFQSLTPDEFSRMNLEINVLSTFQTISDKSELEIDKHGLYIKSGYKQGLLLPQVASEYGWNQIEFLEATCKKAGLSRNTWKASSTEIMVFTADVFNE